MTSNAILIAALVLLPAFGLVAWAWFAMAQVEEDMRSSSGFEGLDVLPKPWPSGRARV